MIFGTHDDNTLAQFKDVSKRATYSALMADGHLGYIMPIGGVAAYRNQISIAGVGYDIACGNCAVKTDNSGEMNPTLLGELADEIAAKIKFGMGGVNNHEDAPVDHQLFNDDRWDIIPTEHREQLRDKARAQLGTVGGGNHYVDVFFDSNEFTWVGVHFGSRGFGHTVASNFLALSADEPWGTRVREHEGLVSQYSDLGMDYVSLMELAGEYAYAGREWVTETVLRMMSVTELDRVHNHHNFAWCEEHHGEWMWVVRKGATPAFPGQRGFVGGSMGDISVILRGATEETPEARKALFSTVHGAGRLMSRSQAKGKWNRKTGEIKRPGLVTQQMMDEAVDRMGVVRRGGDVDEAPQVYRPLRDVLLAQKDTIVVEETLRPLIVVMAEN